MDEEAAASVTVGDLMSEAVCVRQDDRLRDAFAIMVTNDYSQLPVLDADGWIVGSLREDAIAENLALQCAELPDVGAIPVREWLSPPFAEHAADEMICDVAQALRSEPAITIPGPSGHAGYILTRADLARSLLERVHGIPGRPETWSYDETLKRCRQGESEILELKETLDPGRIAREAAAMANTSGGCIVIGVPDEYPIAASGYDPRPSLPLSGKCEESLSSALSDLIDPPLASLARVVAVHEIADQRGMGLLLLVVARSHRLHSINGTYYYRQGSTVRPMTERMVRDRYTRLLHTSGSEPPRADTA